MCIFSNETYNVAKSGSSCQLWKWDPGGPYWSSVLDMTTGYAYQVIRFDQWICAIMGPSLVFYYSTDGSSWSNYTLNSTMLCVVNDQLWSARVNKIRSCTDPSAVGNWSSETDIGGDDINIQELFSLENTLYILKGDGLYVYTADGEVQNILAEFEGRDKNYYAAHVFHNEAYIAGRANGDLLRYSGSVILDISPQLFSPQSSYFAYNYAKGMASDSNWLYCVYGLTSNQTVVFAGKERLGGGWVWHPFAEDSTADPLDCLITTATVYTEDSALFINQDDGKPRYIEIARGNVLPQNWTNYRFVATGYVLTGWWDANLTDVEKAFSYLVIDADDLSSTVYLTFYYETDDSGTWTVIGKAEIDGKTVLPLPKVQVGDETRQPVGRKIRLKIELTTGSSSSTPVLKSFSLHAIPAFIPKRQFTFAVQCADSVALLNATPDTKKAGDIDKAIWGYRKEVWPVTLTDIYGTEWAVKLQYPVQGEQGERPEARDREQVIYLIATEATVS